MAPGIAEMKLLAAALKMYSAFESVDRLAEKWIIEGKKDLNPKELEEYEKRDWYELHDSWERANKNLRDKIMRFEQETGDIFLQTGKRSPILRVEQEKAMYEGEVPVKLFLGLDSMQAKGYRIVTLSHAVWLKSLFESDPGVFFSEGMNEDAIYGLVSGKTLSSENVTALRSSFWDSLKEAGIPAFEPIPGMPTGDRYFHTQRMKPEFESRFEKALDQRKPYENNVTRVQNLEEQIKKEHALAVRKPTVPAVGPPLSPVRFAVPVMPKPEELGRKLEEWYLLFAPYLEKPWQFNYMYRGAWDSEQFKTFEDAKAFISKGTGKLYLHAYRGSEPARWDYPVDMPMFKLQVDTKWESGEGEDRHFYHMQQPYWTGLVWIWRITDNYKFGQVYKQEDLKVSESELLSGKYGYGAKPRPAPTAAVAAAPVPTYELPESIKDKLHSYFVATATQYQLKDLSRFEQEFKEVIAKASSFDRGIALIDDWLESTYQKEKPVVEAEKEKAVLEAVKKAASSKRGFADGSTLWIEAKIGDKRVGTYEDVREITNKLVAKGLIVEPAPGVFKLPAAPASTTEKIKPKFKVGDRVIWKGKAYKIEMTEIFEGIYRYRFFTDEGWAMAREEDLTAAPTVTEEEKEEIKLEEEAEEDRALKPESDVTVYVKVHVEGGVPSDDEGKPKLEDPEFVLMATTYEEFAKHGNNWEAEGMWSRPLIGMFRVQPLVDVLKESEIEYDAIEDNAVAWGNDWDAIREALADNPPPFNKYALFHVKWKPDDLYWSESASHAYEIYLHRYTKEELLNMSKRNLQVICKIKGLSSSGAEGEMIDRIAAFNPEAKEKEIAAVPEKVCAGGACLLPGGFERFNLPVPNTHEELLAIGRARPIVAEYKCVNKKSNAVISDEFYCDICAAELETGVYPGGTVFPSMYPVREYDGVVCRRLWLPGGEQKVKALIAHRKVSPDEGNYLILGKRAIEMSPQVIEDFSMHIKGLSGTLNVDYNTFFSHWDVVPPETKAQLKRIISVGIEPPDDTRNFFLNWIRDNESRQKIFMALGFSPTLFEDTPSRPTSVSAADLLAQQAIDELASEALKDLERF